MSFLRVKDTKIVDGEGKIVILKGSCLGGYLNMENFITGYPGHETEHKQVLESKIGSEKYNFFFKKFYEYFWTEQDAQFYKETLNLTCLRVPFNYRHFIDDDGDLFEIKEEGFKKLDHVIDTCSKYGIYTVLDLHATPGGQNQDWHSDNGTNKSLFWDFKVFQDSMINLWVKIAEHYKDNTWVAGYNPLNEPSVHIHSKLVNFYKRLQTEVRKVDPHHIFFLDANTYAMDFRQFPENPGKVFPNSVFSIHDYTKYGFPMSETYTGSPVQRQKLKEQYNRKVEYMKQNNVPVWNGEFGPVYANDFRGDPNPEETNKSRYHVLRDQLEIYKHGDPSGDGDPISWAIWLYKDLGFQGLTYVNPTSKFYQVFGDWLMKKKTVGLDRWGNDIDPKIKADVYQPVIDHFKEVIPEKYHRALYPHHWTIEDYVTRTLKDMLLSQYAQHEYAELYEKLSFDELDELAASFKFENVIKRKELNDILRSD